MDHFIERRRDEATQADDVHILFDRCLEDFISGYHNAEIDNLVIVAC